MLAAFEDGRGPISTVAWVILGVVVWCVAAVVVAVVIGRMVSKRDRQRPTPPVAMPGQRGDGPEPGDVDPAPRPALAARLSSRLPRRR